ncbi:hypothetical protein NQ314_000758 [Rhamnusium bicolor]|uniref:Uncharacterized protein n=1 Tax=Rhamnusium bicolor TaxID=1586634 RepID=A0AAV8ZVI3_9CUCU|nr:hypothetical protein NQ314_000758 [Rhamnusium bicolor]
MLLFLCVSFRNIEEERRTTFQGNLWEFLLKFTGPESTEKNHVYKDLPQSGDMPFPIPLEFVDIGILFPNK